jgi:hypothetical protein
MYPRRIISQPPVGNGLSLIIYDQPGATSNGCGVAPNWGAGYGWYLADNATWPPPAGYMGYDAWYHIALSWQYNGSGVDDSLWFYVDGIQHTCLAYGPAPRHMDFTALATYTQRFGPDPGGNSEFAYDNMKIWDFAKSNFSDRFLEG